MGEEAWDVVVRAIEGFDGGVLHGGGGREGEELVRGSDGPDEVGGGDGPADFPAGQAEGLAKAGECDGAVGHGGERGEGEVREGGVEGEAFVDLVGDGEGVVLETEGGDEVEFIASEDLAGRVVRGVDEDGTGARGEGAAEVVGIEGERAVA